MARGNWTTRMVWSFAFSHVDLFFMLYLFLPRVPTTFTLTCWLASHTEATAWNTIAPVQLLKEEADLAAYT